MHELSLALNILEFAEEEAERRGAAIEAVYIRLGAMSGVVKSALLSAYDLARENSLLCACRLVIEEVPIMIHCHQCNADRLVPSVQRLCCPECATPASTFIQGNELQVVGLELAA